MNHNWSDGVRLPDIDAEVKAKLLLREITGGSLNQKVYVLGGDTNNIYELFGYTVIRRNDAFYHLCAVPEGDVYYPLADIKLITYLMLLACETDYINLPR